MISVCAALASTALMSQAGDPVARVKQFFDSQPELKVSMQVEFVEEGFTLQQTYWLQRPNRQRLVAVVGSEQYEMRQGPKATIGYNHGEKTYSQQPPLASLLPPPDDAPMHIHAAFPNVIAAGNLGPLPWKEIAARPGAWKTIEAQFGEDALIRADIAADGRILNYGGQIPFGQSLIAMEVRNMQYETATNFSPSLFAGDLPEGYVPAYIPVRHFDMGAGDPVPLDGWTDNGKAVDVKSLMGRRGLAVLFTSPECEVSKRSREAFAGIEKAVKAAGAAMVEVSIGGTQPEGRTPWRRIWDKGYRIADLLSVDATPHMVFIAPDGTSLGYEPGYAESTKSRLLSRIKTIFAEPAE